MIPFRRQHDVGGLEVPARQAGHIPVPIGAIDTLVGGRQLKAFVVIAGDEVHHAAGGIRTIGYRRTVLEDLDPGHGRGREDGGVLRGTTTVEQGQRFVRTDAPQVISHVAGIAGATEIIRLTGGGAGGRQALDEFQGSGRTHFPQVVGGVDLDRQGRVHRCSPYQGSGDNDLLHILRHGGRGNARQHDCQREGFGFTGK